MFCPNCGKDNNQFAKFCEKCGASLEISQAQQWNNEQTASANQAGPMEFSARPDMNQTMTYNSQPPAQPMPFNPQPQAPAQPMSFNPQPQAPAQPMSFNPQPQAPAQPMSFNPQPQAPAQPMSFNPEAIGNAVANDPSRYAEYNMSDVAAAKSHKKLKLALIITGIILVLGVASFFIVRMIIGAMTLNSIKEQPTAYIADSYTKTSEALASQNDVSKIICSTSKKRTSKAKVTYDSFTMTSTSAFDGDAKKASFVYDVDGYGTKMNIQGYTDMKQFVFNASNGTDSVDYYIGLENLRDNAKGSIFGPGGELGISETDYNTFMDFYEFVYNNITLDENQFGLKDLADNVCKDLDECGKVEVTEESTDIDGTNTDAYVIKHTFNDSSIVNKLYVDIKDWASTNLNINSEINQQIMDAIEQIDPVNYTSYIDSENYEIVITHYVNKSKGTIMKAVISVKYNDQTADLTMIFGVDASTSKKISMEVSASGISQTMTVTNEGDDKQDKYVVAFSGAAATGSMTYTRDKSSGEFTITNDVRSTYSNYTSYPSDQTLETSPMASLYDYSGSLTDQTIKGNIKTTDNSVIITISQDSEYSGTINMEVEISNTAEITELSSSNDILKASKDDIQKSFSFLTQPSGGYSGYDYDDIYDDYSYYYDDDDTLYSY